MNLPWLRTTSNTKRLEEDLKLRGWRVWWTSNGDVTLFAPDGAWLTVSGATDAQTVRNAYASAQEYANHQTKQAIDDAYGRGDDLGSVKA